MTRTPLALATSLALAVSGALLLAPPGAEAQPPVAALATTAADDGGPNTYFSSPDGVLDERETSRPAQAKRPKPPPTKGTITGQVVGPGGTPIPRALVTGIRFSDLAQDVGPSQEKAVIARTNGAGQFTLKQLREPYLIRVCS